MLSSERTLRCFQSPKQQRFRLCVAALSMVQGGQIVQRNEDVGMLSAERTLAHVQGPLVERFGLSYLVTLVERHSRYVMLAKVRNRDSRSVVSALIEQARSLPDQLLKTLTWDRGKEMAEHKRFTLETDVAVYFCDPQSPWQRGSNENTNRLLRQYFPRGTDLSVHSQERLDEVAREMNQRPRKTLDYETAS